jgi:hypothetical protein
MEQTEAARCPADLTLLEQPLPGETLPFLLVELDPWGQPYRIDREGPRAFRICSNGADSEPGTDDDIRYPDLDMD